MNTDKNKLRQGESRRDSVIQPRVARNELPWVRVAMENNPEGVESLRARRRCNPVGVENKLGRLPRVVRCAANPGLMDAIPLGLKQRAKQKIFCVFCITIHENFVFLRKFFLLVLVLVLVLDFPFSITRTRTTTRTIWLRRQPRYDLQ